ncbi:MAG: succinyldiaminopimelate transaminase [Gammaproteobacteria bacterium]|nr:succinyldiaminopimelate transaminase [Gammaproteobacteria bacterium]
MNPDLSKLQPYPFQKLTGIKRGLRPPVGVTHVSLSIGEPRHPTPSFIREQLQGDLHQLSAYPTTRGTEELRKAISGWLTRRFKLTPSSLDPEQQVLPVNGTREALFALAQAVVDRSKDPLIMMPNPFYQIYEGAALLAGAEPCFLNCTQENNFIPDYDAIPDDTWDRCQLLYICSPGNPTGAITDMETLKKLINLAIKHDFVIASDECYSEIYMNETNPPPGLLQAAAELGRSDYKNCVVLNSLSKRSSVPGLRSGLIAGDQEIIQNFLLYRTYHGCAMPMHHQSASAAAWNDESHVISNRALYRTKLEAACDILYDVLDLRVPEAGFYLWPRTPVSDIEFTRGLFEQQNITALPGSFLSRETATGNPGENHVRLAMVAPEAESLDAIGRIKKFVESL